MPDHRTILCPTDFSECSGEALRYAEKVAQVSGLRLLLAHAFPFPATWSRDGQNEPEDPTLLEKLQSTECSMPFDTILHAGPPGPVICWLAQEQGCELIIMGTHGRTGLRHLVFGSTAEYVLQHARCPVLTVRHRPADEALLEEPIVMPIPGPGA